MSEKKTETTKGMRFHRFYTYVYLPLSAMLALFMALGRFYYITTISLSTYRGWVELVHATYPLVCCVLSVAALPFLVGKTSVGRRIVLFSETFKSLLALVLIGAYLAYGNLIPALVYTLLVFAMALVYGYYRMREWEFDPIKVVVKKREEPVTPIEKEEKEEPKEEIVEEEKTETKELDSEEEQKTEEVPPLEEEPDSEEKEIVVEETNGDFDPSSTIKLTSIVPATFAPDSPILVEETVIRTEKEKTLISIKARNISEKAFVSSTWSMDGIREFMSNKMITPKEEVTINAQINIPTDRAAIKLISLEEYEGERIDLSDKRQISIPPKHALSSLFKDDRFSFFMSDLKKKEGVDAEWLYMEDGTSSSWLCPKCGIPVYKDENCPLCGIEREKAKTFSASSLTLLFDKAKEN